MEGVEVWVFSGVAQQSVTHPGTPAIQNQHARRAVALLMFFEAR